VTTLAFNNATDLVFSDISSEAWRIYTFPSGATVEIQEPQRLHVSDSGGHRVFDAAGVSHYIPAGWVHLRWKAQDGHPHFVK